MLACALSKIVAASEIITSALSVTCISLIQTDRARCQFGYDTLFIQLYNPLTKRVTVLRQRYWRSRMNMNCKQVALLVLLDLSAASDTVDHNILLARLKSSIGISGAALSRFTSYLNNRSQRVFLNGCTSDSLRLPYGVPQGSCFGPLLFTIYASKLFEVIKNHLPVSHAYADDL